MLKADQDTERHTALNIPNLILINFPLTFSLPFFIFTATCHTPKTGFENKLPRSPAQAGSPLRSDKLWGINAPEAH